MYVLWWTLIFLFVLDLFFFSLSISHACTSFLLLGTQRAESLLAREALLPITTVKFTVAGDAVQSE